MEKLISVLIMAIMFVSQFLASSSLKRKQRIIYTVGGLLPFLAMSVLFFASSRESNLRDEFSAALGWLFPVMFGGQFLALPVLQKRAGTIFARVDDVTQKSRRWLLLFLVPVLFLLFLSTIPNHISYPGGKPIYDEQFFASRLPIWITYLVCIIVILVGVFWKSEIREEGVLFVNQLLDWNSIESYSWYILDNQIRLSLKTKYRDWAHVSSVIYLVKEEKQNQINEFLKGKGIPNLDS